MSFIESPRFPDKIAYGSSGGPGFSTDVITVTSGHETRNQNWIEARHSYDAAFGVTSEPLLSELITFFQAMAGKAHEFRYKDFADYLSCDLQSTPSETDQLLGTGDGIETEFQLIKNYTAGLVQVRTINKPVVGTVLVAVNSVLQTETTHYTINNTTGLITFVTPPGDTLDVTAGYQFDVPCRFDSDQLNISLDAYSVGSTSVPIIEVRI